MSVWTWLDAVCLLLGLGLGLRLERWVLRLPKWVLEPYGDQVLAQDWQGPGGGLDSPPSCGRQWGLALLNAWLWMSMAHWAPASAGLWAVLAWCLCASTLLVLAAVDWNTTPLCPMCWSYRFYVRAYWSLSAEAPV